MDPRKSSILKQKIRVPLQEVMLPDFPDDETVTTTVTRSRRVSFGTNKVKEFIVGSAVSTQCVSEYEQAFSSSDSSNTNSSRSATASHFFEQSTFSSREDLRMSSEGHALNLTMNRSHVNTENISVSVKNSSDKNYEFEVDKKQLTARSDVLKQSKNLTDLHLGPEKVKHDDSRLRGKCGKFSSTICFSADSPTADMEFTEGCITLAKSILDKKKKAITVFIQAKPKDEEIEPEGDETFVFETSDAEMSITKCVKADKSMMDVDDFNDSDIDKEKLFQPRNDFNSDDETEENDLKKAFEMDPDTEKSLFSPQRKLSDMLYFPENDSMDFSMESPVKSQGPVGMELTNCVVAKNVAQEKIEATIQTSAMDFTKCAKDLDDSANMSITENFVNEPKADFMEETPCKKIPLNRSHVSFQADMSSESEDSMELTGCLSIPTNQDVSKLFSLPVEIVEEENKVKIDSLDDSSSDSLPKRDSVDSFVGGLFNGNGRDVDMDVSIGLKEQENVGLDLTKHAEKKEESFVEEDFEDDEKENTAPEEVRPNEDLSDMNVTDVVEEQIKKRISMKDPEEEILPPQAECSKMDISLAQEEMIKVVEQEEIVDEKTLTPEIDSSKSKPDCLNIEDTLPVPEELEVTSKTMNITNILSKEGISFPKESTPLKDIEVRRMNLTGIIPKITPQKIMFDENDITRGQLYASLKVVTELNDLGEAETPSPSILPMKDLASPTVSVPGFEEKNVSPNKVSSVNMSGVAAIDQENEIPPEDIKEAECSNMAVDVPECSLLQEGNEVPEENVESVPGSNNTQSESVPEAIHEEHKPNLESSKLNLSEPENIPQVFSPTPEKETSVHEEPEKSLNVTNILPKESEEKIEKSCSSMNLTNKDDLVLVPSPKRISTGMELDDSFIPEKDMENAMNDLEFERLVHGDLKDIMNDTGKSELKEPENIPENLPQVSPCKSSNPMDLDDFSIPEKINNSEIKMDFNSSQPDKLPDKSTTEPENDLKNNSRSTSVNINSNTITINTDTPHNDRTAATFTVTPRNTTYVVPNHTFVLENEKVEKSPVQPEKTNPQIEKSPLRLEKSPAAEKLPAYCENSPNHFEKSSTQLEQSEKSPNLELSIKAAVKRPSLEMSPCVNTSQTKKHRLSSDFCETGIRLVTDHSFNEMDSVTLDDINDEKPTQETTEQPNQEVTEQPSETENNESPSEMEIDTNSKSFNIEQNNTSGDSKIMATITEQSNESECLWKIKGFKNSTTDNHVLWSFSFELLNSSVVIDFKLKTSSDDSYSDVIDSQIYLIHDDEYSTSKYLSVTDFGFNKMKKHFEDEKKIDTVRHIPYFLDIVNSFSSKLNNYLKQILAILKQYPGSKLNNDTLSFRLFSFPLLFSTMVTIDLKNLFRLSKNNLSFEMHFGEMSENEIKDVFEESLKYENSLIDFIISSTKHVIRLEIEKGRVSKRDHIQLLPDYLKL